MARIDDTEIGGKEYGAVRLRALGNTTLEDAQAYESIGRQLLGDFKRELYLGGVKVGQRERKLPDGTLIRVMSNMAGLSHIDEIYVEKGRVGGGKKRCIGYIVQGFTDSIYYSVQFDLTTPSGERLPYTSDASYGAVRPQDISPPGVDASNPFVDSGAKYLDYYKSGVQTDFQEVVVSFNYYYSEYSNLGANVYSVAPIGDGQTGPYFVGDGHLTYVWDTSLVINVTPENWYNSTTFDIPAYEYSDTNPDTAWNLLGISFNDWMDHGANYINTTYWESIIIPRINAIAAEAYSLSVAAQDTSVGYDYKWLYSDGAGGTFQRRRDSRGFVTNMGFEMVHGDPDFSGIGGSGVVFHELGRSHGEGALFMMPATAERRNLKLAQPVKDYQTALNDTQVTETITGSINAVVGGLTPGLPLSGPGAWSYVDNAPGPNIIQTAHSKWVPADTFAIPVKVEEGIHKVKVKRQSVNVDLKKLKIYLLLVGDQSGLAVYEIPGDKIVLADTETEWSKELHILVGEYNQLPDIVTLAEITDTPP